MKRGSIFFSLLFLAGTVVSAQGVRVEAPVYTPGGNWTIVQLDEPSQLPLFERGWTSATFWDLRPPAGTGVSLRWSVLDPHEAGWAPLRKMSGPIWRSALGRFRAAGRLGVVWRAPRPSGLPG